MTAVKETIRRPAAKRLRSLSAASTPLSHRVTQRFGNHALQHLLCSRLLQAKLTVGPPDDIYEQEADRVADDVMRMPDPVQAEPLSGAALQRQAAPEDEDPAQTKGGGERPPIVGAQIEGAIHTLPGRGEPLPQSVRSFMEPRFNADFSAVHVHTEAYANDLARAVSAQAFTVGRDVVFGTGHYAPDTDRGKHLLAHELTHVVQQGARPRASNPLTEPGSIDGPHERAAALTSARLSPGPISHATASPVLQRQLDASTEEVVSRFLSRHTFEIVQTGPRVGTPMVDGRERTWFKVFAMISSLVHRPLSDAERVHIRAFLTAGRLPGRPSAQPPRPTGR